MTDTPSPKAAQKAAKYAPTSRHPEGREARAGDIVQGIVHLPLGDVPFIGRVKQVLQEAGRAGITLLRRPGSMPYQLSFFHKQNLAFRTYELYTAGLEELTLRSRSTRRPQTTHPPSAQKHRPGGV